MVIGRVWGVLVFSACLLAACGGGGGGALTLDQYAARVEESLCTISVRCGTLPDRASCVYVADVAQAKADVQSGKTTFDGAMAAVCLDTLETYDCLRSTVIFEGPTCQNIASGTVADGGPCTESTQCSSLSCTTPANCNRNTTCCAGTCAPADVTVAEGGDCSRANTTCALGLYCDVTASASTCVKRSAAGATCSNLIPCLETLRCAQPTAADKGICATYPKRGQPCTGGGSFACDDQRDFCDPTTGNCLARLAVGASCANADEGCVFFAVCDPTSHQCVKKSGLGQSCTDNNSCLTLLSCDANGKCAAPPSEIVCP